MGTSPRTPSAAVEDYLKVIFNLGEWDDAPVTNLDVAARLGVSTASASEMVRKLGERGLVEHERYGGIELSATGRVLAVGMVRRHRLVETYLVQRLGYSWDEVHDEAEVLEHAVSPLLLDRLDLALGCPFRDPHGDPVPTSDGVLHHPVSRLLSTLAVGESGYVVRIVDDEPGLLRWFSGQGLGLDAEVVVVEQRPFGGPLVVELRGPGGSSVLDLGIQAAAALWVAPAPPLPGAASGSGSCPYPDCRHD